MTSDKDFFTYLKELERERSFFLWFTPQMAAMDSADPKPGYRKFSWVSQWVAGPKYIRLSSTPFPDTLAGNRI